MRIRETVQRAFASFLALPTAVIAGFGLLAIGTYWLDQSGWSWLEPIRNFMQDHVFGSEQSTANLLATIAGGVITITSITFSLLLLALQQSAGALTHDVFDQFLRRRANQVYFGFFVGLTLYSLIVLISVDPPFNPVIGATLALVLTVAALYILLLLIYASISQMRPNEIVRAIHDMTLKARNHQQSLLARTRRSAVLSQMPATVVRAPRDGFVTGIDLDAIAAGLDHARGSVEVSYLRSIGSYVAFQDPVAEIRGEHGAELAALADRVASATDIRQDRDIDTDPAYGIDQLATIAWRSISTSQQNPSPGIATVNALHDLLARWSVDRGLDRRDRPLPVVYPDNVMAAAFGALESLTVGASESMQHQTYAAILNAIAVLLERLCPTDQQRAEDLVLRSLSGLGDQILTRDLDDALAALAESLDTSGALDTAQAVRVARNALAKSIGRLNSRSTRVPD
jgi:hypothetical protein